MDKKKLWIKIISILIIIWGSLLLLINIIDGSLNGILPTIITLVTGIGLLNLKKWSIYPLFIICAWNIRASVMTLAIGDIIGIIIALGIFIYIYKNKEYLN